MWKGEWVEEVGDGGKRRRGEACFRAMAGLFVWLDTASPVFNLRLG